MSDQPLLTRHSMSQDDENYLRGPLIVFREYGWQIPNWLWAAVQIGRVLQVARATIMSKERGLASYEETLMYLHSTLHPLACGWDKIFLWLIAQVVPAWGMEDLPTAEAQIATWFASRELTTCEHARLRLLREWLYQQAVSNMWPGSRLKAVKYRLFQEENGCCHAD